jgi:hypothetical protein
MSDFHRILAEIATTIEIDQNFSVSHPDYPPLELELSTVERFQSLPFPLQTKYLIVQVQNYLHDIYFTHVLQTQVEIESQSEQLPQIKNNIIDGIDRDFAYRLHTNNLSNGYFDPGWEIVAEIDDGMAIVVKDGLNLHIDPHQHLPKELRRFKIGDIVPIYLPKNLLGEDSYIAVGNFGLPDRGEAVELYFNFTPAAAIAIEQPLIRELNKLGIPFQFEILFNPEEFYRYDAGILCLPKSAYPSAKSILSELYQTHQVQFSPEVPLFTKPLAPGLGIAETPTITSFGLHRCDLLATALVTAHLTAVDPMTAIADAFTPAGIALDRPYLQPDAVDDYHKLLV